MIFTQSAKDEQNKVQRTKNLIESLKQHKLLSLVIEPASICNLKCNFCDLQSGRLNDNFQKQKNGIMDINFYQHILDEINSLNFKFETVFFHGNGEPLLNKNFIYMVKEAVDKDISKKYTMFTNGTLMNPDVFDKLMISGINEINISLDTINQDIYKKVKGKDLLLDVLDNIDYAIEKVLQHKTISLIIKTGIGGDMYGVSDKNVQQIIDKYKDIAIDSPYVHIKTVPIVEVIDGMSKKKKEYHTPCELPFYMMYIKYDGRVSPCCADVIDAINIGNLKHQSFKNVIEGQKLHDMRLTHLSGSLDKIPLCKYCGNRTLVDLSKHKDEVISLI